MSELTRRNALKMVAATGLAVTVGHTADAEEKKTSDRWRAWAVTEGDHTKLVVEGIYSQGGPGLVVTVAAAVPQGINPKILLLDLKTTTLPGIWPAVLQPVPAYYVKTPYTKGTYTAVHLRYPDGAVVMLETITDAGKGPK